MRIVRIGSAAGLIALLASCASSASSPEEVGERTASATTPDSKAIRAEEMRQDFLGVQPSDRRKTCAYWVTDQLGTEFEQWRRWKDSFRFENPDAGNPVAPTRTEVKAFYRDVCADAPTAEELLDRQPGRVDFIGVGIEVLRDMEGVDLCERFAIDRPGAAKELYEPSSFDPDITLTHAEAALLKQCG